MSDIWGATVLASNRARFRLWAPDREAVSLELRDGASLAMAAVGEGWFEVEAEAAPGVRYRYRLDADLAVADPASRAQDGGVNGWSVLVDPHAYRWQTTDWAGRPWRETVLQEVHVGLFGGFAGFGETLEEIAALGVTAIELMPINAFGGARNWGYDGVLPYAPAESYGSPDDLKALVDRAHALGLMVFLDVVYNHFGPDGNYLGEYARDFFHPERKTPWGGAVAVDRAPARRYFIDNALMWLKDYRFDGLRFDAVHAIEDNAFLDAMAAEIRATIIDRPVHLVLENERNDADRLAPGGYDAQWNDDFHNVLHVLLTGESSGYYEDFAQAPAERLARCLAEGFIFQGEGMAHQDGKPRGTPSAHLQATAFVTFLQNHDQIGNRAMGERLTVLADPAKLRAATALLLLCPQIPLLFMGDDTGSQTPFLFFTDFHDELAEAVREGRRGEFAKFAAFADPAAREKIPDPNAEATFARSVPQPGSDAQAWRELYRTLLALRHAEIVPRLDGAMAIDAEAIAIAAVVARWRMGDGATLGIAINLGDEAVAFPSASTPMYAQGEAGAPASFLAWLDPA